MFRFAPSPNGYLHLGHALSALLNFDLARAAGGRFLLRIEDIDAARCRPDYEQAIYDDLAWLGITWEQPVRRQSAHFDDYRAALARLDAMGLVYPSFESRGEIARLVAARETHAPWPRDPDGAPLYPGDARALAPCGTPAADGGRRALCAAPRYGGGDRAHRRADLERNRRGTAKPARSRRRRRCGATWCWRARRRRPAITSRSWSTTRVQGVTHVVRGQDLFWSTSVHRVLQALLGLPAPIYHHHRLILDAEGQKAIQIDARDRLARAAREWCYCRRHPPDGRAGVRACGRRLRAVAISLWGCDA